MAHATSQPTRPAGPAPPSPSSTPRPLVRRLAPPRPAPAPTAPAPTAVSGWSYPCWPTMASSVLPGSRLDRHTQHWRARCCQVRYGYGQRARQVRGRRGDGGTNVRFRESATRQHGHRHSQHAISPPSPHRLLVSSSPRLSVFRRVLEPPQHGPATPATGHTRRAVYDRQSAAARAAQLSGQHVEGIFLPTTPSRGITHPRSQVRSPPQTARSWSGSANGPSPSC